MHLHSTHSDGMLTPAALVRLAAEKGLGALTLTDHDVASGYEEAEKYAREYGLETMRGVEFCSVDKNGICSHILAYDFDAENPDYKKFLKGHCDRRNQHTRAFFEYAKKAGKIKGITWDEVLELNKGARWFSNNQIFRAMELKGIITREEYFPWYEENFGSKAELNKKLSLRFPEPEETISVISSAGGVSVYAHPSITGPEENRLSYVKTLIEMGVRGVEANHPLVPFEDSVILRKTAEENNLYVTGGTDHTGIFAGFAGGGYGKPEDNPEPDCYASREEYLAIKNRTNDIY